MKKCYLDSNLLIYFKDEASTHHSEAKNIIQKLLEKNYDLYVSPLVLDELTYVFHYTLSSDKFPQLKKIISDILELPGLFIVNPPTSKDKQKKVVDFMEKYSLQPRDAYHILTIKEESISYLATFDADFQKVFEQNTLKQFK